MSIPITGLINLQTAELGEKWLEAIKTPEGVANMVSILADHLAESMAKAYQTGIEDHKNISLLQKR